MTPSRQRAAGRSWKLILTHGSGADDDRLQIPRPRKHSLRDSCTIWRRMRGDDQPRRRSAGSRARPGDAPLLVPRDGTKPRLRNLFPPRRIPFDIRDGLPSPTPSATASAGSGTASPSRPGAPRARAGGCAARWQRRAAAWRGAREGCAAIHCPPRRHRRCCEEAPSR